MASKQEQDRKDLEERLAKAQINFERAAIESKKKMARLEEENERAKGAVQVVRLKSKYLLRLLMQLLLWLLLLFVVADAVSAFHDRCCCSSCCC